MLPATHAVSADQFGWDSIAAFLTFWLQSNPLDGKERRTFESYYRGYLHRFGPYIQHHFSEQTREIVAAIRSTREQPRVLEVGAGCGTESLWFALLGADVTGIDLDSDRLAVAEARRKWLREHVRPDLLATFAEKSLFDFETSHQFDLIWMEQAFHHIEPRHEVFKKLDSLLARDGRIVISEANAWNLPLQLQLLRRRGFRTKLSMVDSQGRIIEYGNERITTPSALCRQLKRNGFEVMSCRSFRMLPNSNPPSYWLPMEQAILKYFPFLSTHFNVMARKKD